MHLINLNFESWYVIKHNCSLFNDKDTDFSLFNDKDGVQLRIQIFLFSLSSLPLCFASFEISDDWCIDQHSWMNFGTFSTTWECFILGEKHIKPIIPACGALFYLRLVFKRTTQYDKFLTFYFFFIILFYTYVCWYGLF